MLDHRRRPAQSCVRFWFDSRAPVPWQVQRVGTVLTINPETRLIVGTNGSTATIGHVLAGRGLGMMVRNGLYLNLATGVPVAVPSDG